MGNSKKSGAPAGHRSFSVLRAAALVLIFLLPELLAAALLKPDSWLTIAFSLCWCGIAVSLCLTLPRRAGQILYGIAYYFLTLWSLAQTGYHHVFHKLMWLSDILYASEGAAYFDTVLAEFPPLWWIGAVVLLAMGVLAIRLFPRRAKYAWKPLWLLLSVPAVAGLCLLPRIFSNQEGASLNYRGSSADVAVYTTLYDAEKAYPLCGIYQLTFRDLWLHHLYPLTPGYRTAQAGNISQIDAYLEQRGEHPDNSMTGIFQGKNVILVLMESMDDWALNQEDTPTLLRLMDEGISFHNFYTPCYGSVRTFNSEFCTNTGIYCNTAGSYAFRFITNNYDESLANQLTHNGYTAQTFHYNSPDFYSRGDFEPAMGYQSYISYEDYVEEDDQLFDDCFLFDSPELMDEFFRDGPTLNFVITRSAHLSYIYREVLSNWALKQYPQYRGISGDEEVDCMRVKAKLVDDFFARLLQELEARGQLENTVIVGFTDHYTYGFEDTDLLMELSGVDDMLLLEKTPCFIWSADGPDLDVDKALHTADLLPTVLNLMGIESPYRYLGQDAFDPRYPGTVYFPNGSWVSDGVVCKANGDKSVVLENKTGREVTQEEIQRMTQNALEFTQINNLILQSDYYRHK